MQYSRIVRRLGIALIAMLLLALAAPAAAQGRAALVSVGSPSNLTLRNHQNEPAVAIDAHAPTR